MDGLPVVGPGCSGLLVVRPVRRLAGRGLLTVIALVAILLRLSVRAGLLTVLAGLTLVVLAPLILVRPRLLTLRMLVLAVLPVLVLAVLVLAVVVRSVLILAVLILAVLVLRVLAVLVRVCGRLTVGLRLAEAGARDAGLKQSA